MSERAGGTTGGFGARLGQALRRRVVWLTDERRDGTGAASDSMALVAVLGREHYSERRKSFPILSRRDLDAVLKQELAGAPPTLTAVSASRDDRREVTFYELKPESVTRAGPALWLVPESLALAATLDPARVATVERHGFRYFLAANGVSQPAGGAVTTAELFAMAAGLDATEGPVITAEDLGTRLLAGLRRLPPDSLLRFRTPSLGPRIEVDWKPMLAAAGVALVAYLALASGYLTLTREAREKELAGLGGEVEKLLASQRDVDRMLVEQSGLAAVMADRRSTYRIWQAVAVAWGKGAVITGVQLKDAELTLRGNAPVATDVLAALDAMPGFADAKFSAPVRGVASGREDFAVTLTLKNQPEKDRG